LVQKPRQRHRRVYPGGALITPVFSSRLQRHHRVHPGGALIPVAKTTATHRPSLWQTFAIRWQASAILWQNPATRWQGPAI